MAAIRLIPKTDDAEFPRQRARQLIEELPDVRLGIPDFEAMIAAGRQMGWPEELVKANEDLALRGNCLEFEWDGPPTIVATLYEDNIFFAVVDDYSDTLSFITSWAATLDVRVHEHDPPPPEPKPCPHCGIHLRSAQAKQCFACGADWH